MSSTKNDETRKKEWFHMGSEAHEKIIKVLFEKILLGHLEQMTEQVNTITLELFHAVKIDYLPKKRVSALTK